MWNSPSSKRGRDLKITPRQADGLTSVLDFDRAISCDDMQPSFMFSAPEFKDVPPNRIFVEAVKVIESLVTDIPVPQGGHCALHEAILYSLAVSLFDAASEREEEGGNDLEFQKAYLAPINAIRRLAGQRALKTLKHATGASWEDTLDSVFFWDRDWQMRKTLTKARRNGTDELIHSQLGIDKGYYAVDMREPTDEEIAEAERRFRAIWRFGDRSPRHLPPNYLDRPDVGLL